MEIFQNGELAFQREIIIGIDAVDIRTHAHTAAMVVKVKSVPGKISVRLCGMLNQAGLREVAREFFTNRRKGFLPAGCGQEPGE